MNHEPGEKRSNWLRGGKNEDIIGAVVPCPVKSPSDHLTSLQGPRRGNVRVQMAAAAPL